MEDKQKRYNQYVKRITKCQVRIQCVLCPTVLLPKQMTQHCFKEHALDTKQCCLWCGGSVKWKPKQKMKHLSHLVNCFENLPKIYKRKKKKCPERQQRQLEQHTLLEPYVDLEVPCPAFEFRTMKGFLPDILPETYRPFNVPPTSWIYDEGSDPASPLFPENIQLGTEYVQKFIRSQQKYKLYHVMVKAIVINQFYRLMQRGYPHLEIYTLEFSCWCNGGKAADPYLRQHKHMIVVSEGPLFMNNVWTKVAITEEQRKRLGSQFKCKKYKRIRTPEHLTNTIGYLSQPRSQCNFSFDEAGHNNAQHDYIAVPLPKIFSLCIATQIGDGAILKFLKPKLQSKSVDAFIDEAFQIRDSWHILLKDIAPTLCEVVPVLKHWEPVQEETDIFFYLVEGKKLYFKRNPRLEKMTDQEWTKHQMERGNYFYGNVGKFPWQLGQNQQQSLNSFKKIRNRYRIEEERKTDQIQKMETEIGELRTEIGELRKGK